MRVINIIRVERNEVKKIEAFPIWEEEFSEDVIDEAKVCFAKELKAIQSGIDDDEIENHFMMGMYNFPYGCISVIFSYLN